MVGDLSGRPRGSGGLPSTCSQARGGRGGEVRSQGGVRWGGLSGGVAGSLPIPHSTFLSA